MKTTDLSTINLNMSDDDKKRPLVFYGAGNWAKAHFSLVDAGGAGIVCDTNIAPVCFADKDERKHNTVFCGYKVYSVKEALTHYPNALVVLTCGFEILTSVVQYLSEIVSPELLRYPYETYYGMGCQHLGTNFTTLGDNLVCCSGKGFINPNITMFAPWDEIFLEHKNFCEAVIKKLITGDLNACSGCPELNKGFHVVKPELHYFGLGSNFRGTNCNYLCPKCSHLCLNESKNNKYDQIVASEFIKYFWDNHKRLGIKINYSRFVVSIAIGEPTLLPDFKNFLDFINSKEEIAPLLLSNASIYSEPWAETLQNNVKSEMLVDISAGTVETYKKIKGVVCFDKVLDNLVRYKSMSINPDYCIRLKYTFYDGINDNFDDVNGFLKIAKKLKCRVEFSTDVFGDKKITNTIRELFMYMENELKREKIQSNPNVCYARAFDRAEE